MKQRLKQITKFIAICALLALSSCEKDLYDDNIYQNEILKKKITLEEFKNHRKAFSNFEKIEQRNEIARTKKRNSTGKLVYDENYGFYIDIDNIVYMENEGYKSFTFPIYRDQETEKMENLILSSKIDDSQFKTYLAKYDLTESEILMIENNIVVPNIVNKTDIETLNGENIITNGVVSKQVYVDEDGNCYVIDKIKNIGGGMVEITYIQVDCGYSAGDAGSGNNSGGGSGGTGSGSSSGNTGGSGVGSGVGSGSSSGNSGGSGAGSGAGSGNGSGGGFIGTSPLSNDFITPPNPCLTLKKHLSTTTGLKLKSPSLIPALQNTLSQPVENGNSLVKNGNTYSTPSLSATNTSKIKVPYGGNNIGSIHTHPYPNSVPMFSYTDLFSIQLFLQEAFFANQNEVVIFLVCKDSNGVNQVYALKVEDDEALYNAITADISANITPTEINAIPAADQQDYILQKMDNNMTRVYSNNSDKELAFLNKFSNFGVSLYKANSNLTNWSKLTVQNPNTTNASILLTPCN